MREYIVKFDTDEPPSEFPYGTNVRALMKITGDCDEVIRCKDCIKKDICADYMFSQQEEGYCAWAARKEE